MGVGCSCLEPGEYLILDYPTDKTIRAGPGCIPFCCATSKKHRGITLDQRQYLEVRHMNNRGGNNDDVLEIISASGLYIPNDPFAQISEVKSKTKLKVNEYIIVEDRNGNKTMVEGPTLFTPGPYDKFGQKLQKPNLSGTQYIIVTDTQTGAKKTVEGPGVYTPSPLEVFSEPLNKIILNIIDYVYVTHTQTGVIEIVEGPQTFAPMPFDHVSEIKKKIVLKQFEYIKIVDKNSGIVRVEKGPSTIILMPTEQTIRNNNDENPTRVASEINQDTAAYIRNTDNGNYELVQKENDGEPFMFFPSPTQEVIEIRKRIKLQEYEAMVITDKNGKCIFMRGDNGTGSFFVPPYCNILKQQWSSDLQKKRTQVNEVAVFNLRPQYMDYQFSIRTKDNVDIEIELNFYWQIVDIEKMISVTSDPPQDICNHAMSQILAETSRKDMKEFMESFNEIVEGAISKDDSFYAARGIKIYNVRIIRRTCKEADIEKALNEFLIAKANRLRNTTTQEGENEVRFKKLEGDIRAEELEGQKLNVRKQYARQGAQTDGEAKGAEISHFLESLPTNLTQEQKLAIYFDKMNTDRVNSLTHSGAPIVLTQKDADFSMVNVNYQDQNPNKRAAGNSLVDLQDRVCINGNGKKVVPMINVSNSAPKTSSDQSK